MRRSWYGELRDPTYFRTVHLIDGGAGIAWANGQDLAPHELYELGVTVSGDKEPFNYTEWQREYFDGVSPETIRKEALEYAESHPYAGDASKLL